MDLSRMRAGDYPVPPEAWQQAGGLGDLRYGVQYDRYEYMNGQCRYCGHFCAGPANGVTAHPRALCLACGTPQCANHGTCLVCMAGYVGHPPYQQETCGYAGCDGPAVAKAPRVRRVCLGCLAKPVVIRGGNVRISLADTIAAALLQRDRGGQSWQKIAWFGPPKRYYVHRVHEDGREGWEGRPYDTAGQADRGAECWNDPKVTGGGWHAERVEATPEVRQLVDAWQADADRRHGRTAQARSRTEASC